MNPNAATFTPSSPASTSSKSSPPPPRRRSNSNSNNNDHNNNNNNGHMHRKHHHTNGHRNGNHHSQDNKSKSKLQQIDRNASVRINRNILPSTVRQSKSKKKIKKSSNSNSNSGLTLSSPLSLTPNRSTSQSPISNNIHSHSQQQQSPLSPEQHTQQLAQQYLANVQYNEYMQALTDQIRTLHLRINTILQPQLNDVSNEMRSALINSNHITQPEYYAGLQNQQLILSHTMKQAQTEYQTLCYQLSYYQSIALQQHQHAQAQAQAQQQQQQQQQQQSIVNAAVSPTISLNNLLNVDEDETKQNAFNSLNSLTFDQSTMNMMDGVTMRRGAGNNANTQQQQQYNRSHNSNDNGNDNKKKHKKHHHSSKQDLFERRLCGIMCRLSPDKFDKMLTKCLEFLDNHIQSQNEIKIYMERLIKFTMHNAYFSPLLAKLFLHFYDYLPRLIMTQQYQQHLWDSNDIFLSFTFRRILINYLENTFVECLKAIKSETNCEQIENKQNEFYALMEVLGELYNVDLLHVRLIRKGVLDRLLPPNICQIMPFDVMHIKALCCVLSACGKKMEENEWRLIYKYMHKMNQSIELLPEENNEKKRQNAKHLLSELNALRCNNWIIHRIAHNQKYKNLNFFSFPLDEVRENDENCQSDDENEQNEHNLRQQNGKFYLPLDTNSQCYAYNESENCLTSICDGNVSQIGYINSMQFGYNGSCYILSDEGQAIVSGNNKFGELGIQNEIICTILRHSFDNLINRDMAYLICSFVDEIKYKLDYINNDGAMLIKDPLLENCHKISGGVCGRHRFILTANNQLYGSGNNLFNQLGVDRKCIFNDIEHSANGNNKDRALSEAYTYRWTKINFFNTNELILRQIQCGYCSSTFLCSDGCIYTVGFSPFGNLGFGEKENKLFKIRKIQTIKTKIDQICVGFDHTLALNEYRNVISFGDNAFGQLGHGHLMQNRRQKPKEIDYFRKHGVHAVSVQCGAFHSVVLDCNGLVYCFGHNSEFQCFPKNDDANLNISLPRVNIAMSQICKVKTIKCGGFHNIVQTQLNEWWLWGDNRNKQCLVYDTKAQYIKVPTKYHQNDIAKNEYIIDLFAGYDETRVVTTK